MKLSHIGLVMENIMINDGNIPIVSGAKNGDRLEQQPEVIKRVERVEVMLEPEVVQQVNMKSEKPSLFDMSDVVRKCISESADNRLTNDSIEKLSRSGVRQAIGNLMGMTNPFPPASNHRIF